MSKTSATKDKSEGVERTNSGLERTATTTRIKAHNRDREESVAVET